jgi:DNA-binding FrmR family transcriptional regulator
MTKQIPRGRRRSKEQIEEAHRQSLLGSAVKDRELENEILRKREEKPKNWPCAYRSLEKGERVSHFDELDRLKRVIGQLEGVRNMIKSREFRCNTAIDQLLSASQVLKRIALFMLKRHLEICLKEGDFPGDRKELQKEFEYALRYFVKLDVSPEGISLNVEERIEREALEIAKDLEILEKNL